MFLHRKLIKIGKKVGNNDIEAIVQQFRVFSKFPQTATSYYTNQKETVKQKYKTYI